MTLEGLTELVKQNDEKADEAHRRLRESLVDLTTKVESNYDYFRTRAEANLGSIKELRLDFDNLGNAPVNLDKLFFTPRVVAAVVIALLSIYGFFLASTNSLRSDLHDLKSTLDARQMVDKARAETQDVQNTSLRNDVNDMKRQLQLEQYEIQNLKTLISDRGKSH